MGSGKGKSRRARAAHSDQVSAPAATPAVLYSPEKWKEFAENGELERVRILRYYLGQIPQRNTKISLEELNELYEKAATELFTDAVAVGAITLPSPYSVDDFEFKIATGETIDKWQINICLRGNPELEENIGHAWYLKDNKPLTSADTRHLVMRTFKGTQALISRADSSTS